MILETERLILRPWQESDAEDLFTYAKDPRVGPSAGWPVHKDVENSREIIRDVLSAPGTYAVVLKALGKAVGSVGLSVGSAANFPLSDKEGEIGCWIGVPFWGQGLIPEAVRELLRHGFQDLNLQAIWYGWFDGNDKSRRVQEKCGFTWRYSHTIYWERLGKELTEHAFCLSREAWEKTNA